MDRDRQTSIISEWSLPTSIGRSLERRRAWPWSAHIIDGNMSTARVTSSDVVGFKLRIGFVGLGNLQFELLQPVDYRSPLAEYLKVHGEDMHHFGYLVRSTEHELDAMAASDDGQRPALLAEGPSNDGHGISVCYIDGKMGTVPSSNLSCAPRKWSTFGSRFTR